MKPPPSRLTVPLNAGVDVLLERGLPSDILAEQTILGVILLSGGKRFDFAAGLSPDDFAVEKHRRIFTRMIDLDQRGEPIDRITLANELKKRGELESVDGLGYIVSLDDLLPQVSHPESYVRSIREKTRLRRIAIAADHVRTRALLGEDPPEEVLKGLDAMLLDLRLDSTEASAIDELPPVTADCNTFTFIREPELPHYSVVALTGNSGSGKSTIATAWARDAVAADVPVLILDRENSRSAVVDRMNRLGFADNPRLLRWDGGWNGQEARGPDSPAVIAWVKRCETKPLVIVDSLAAFLEGDENSVKDMRRFMKLLKRLADFGACVIIIHHDGKAETAKDFRGSSDFIADLDQAFHVRNLSANLLLDRLRLRCFKSRPGFIGELFYRYDDGKMTREGAIQCLAKEDSSRFAKLLADNPGVTKSRFEELAVTARLGRNQARDFLDKGVTAGIVAREPGPRGAQVHALSASASERFGQQVPATDTASSTIDGDLPSPKAA